MAFVVKHQLGKGVVVEFGLRSHQDGRGILGVLAAVGGGGVGGGVDFGSLDVTAGVAFGEVWAGEGLDEGDVAGFIVGFEVGWGGSWLAPGEDEGGVGHCGYCVELGLCAFVIGLRWSCVQL